MKTQHRREPQQDGIPVHELDMKTVRWFLRYLTTLKQKANVAGYIAESCALGRIRDDVEMNIQRGLPSSLVVMKAGDE